jgi:hypothetical protein
LFFATGTVFLIAGVQRLDLFSDPLGFALNLLDFLRSNGDRERVESLVEQLDKKGDSWVVPKGSRHTYKIIETFTAVEATSPPAEVHGRDDNYLRLCALGIINR